MISTSDLIYVAGHTGLIGSAIVRRLKDTGYNNLLLRTHSELDLTNPVETFELFKEFLPNYVVLAAGRVGGIIENQKYPADFLNTNLAIQLNVLSAAKASGVKKLILFGSSCMYPRECDQPMNEEALLTGKPEATSMAYAVSKLAGVQLCLAYNQQYGETRYIPLIPNSAYGPNDNFDPQSGHVLSALMRRFHEAKKNNVQKVELWGTGSPRREFVYADDIAEACICVLKRDLSSSELPINLGVGYDFSIAELAEKIANVVGYQGTIVWDKTKPDGAPRKLLDSSRLISFGWKPSVGLEDGLAITNDWFVSNISE